MLDHQARKDASFAETAQVFAELTRLAPIIDKTRFVPSAAILTSEDIGWAWNHIVSERLMPLMATSDISDQGRLMRYYEPLYRAKVCVDVLGFDRDLSAYPVVFVPNLYLVKPEIVQNLTCYVEQGGLLILGPKAGLKNWSNVFYPDLAPACGLSELLGVTVARSSFRYRPATNADACVTMTDAAPFALGTRYANPVLHDPLVASAAQVWATHETGEAAITANSVGTGTALYLGCEPEPAFYDALIAWLVGKGLLDRVLETDADLEVTLRVGGGHRLIFVLNHGGSAQQLDLPRAYRELITERTVEGSVDVAGRTVLVLDEAST